MYTIKILPPAKQDIRDSAQWYNKRQKGLGKRFSTEVKQRVLFIKDNPLTIPTRYKNVRAAVLKVFPFTIYFKIQEDQKLINIIAVIHTSRDPKIWKER